ncbi:SH3 domain-containing protein [Actinomadura mexicana]|uniref:SH3 domain-containing protein n=1 Tax=Actinomadura mexicana TaxID=134959 RepID=A0A238YVE2_9ACTN|nr:SH3 domain-containing protein [Actinomadura mexicana]SNR74429.1 SH3 domain-containing protein [Actinomadura mexicana]
MHVGTKFGVVLVATTLAGSALGAGAVAGAAPPPRPGQDGSATVQSDSPQEEEGHGPGAIEVGPEGAARAMHRLLIRDEQRVRLCDGVVLPADGLNVRTGPGTGYTKVGVVAKGSKVRTDWDSIQRRDGYLWVRLNATRWIADYKLGADDGAVAGKWYVNYSNC